MDFTRAVERRTRDRRGKSARSWGRCCRHAVLRWLVVGCRGGEGSCRLDRSRVCRRGGPRHGPRLFCLFLSEEILRCFLYSKNTGSASGRCNNLFCGGEEELEHLRLNLDILDHSDHYSYLIIFFLDLEDIAGRVRNREAVSYKYW